MVDDIVDTGHTILGAVDLLKSHGAKAIYICVTHPVFSQQAITRIEKSHVQQFFVTDTIEQPASQKIKVISIAPLLARVIENMHEGKPLSPIFDEFTAL
jgi:ribose-phosphate pyrophosphokinase